MTDQDVAHLQHVHKQLQVVVADRINISAMKREIIVWGLVRITAALQAVVCPSIIVHGWERTGLCPLNFRRCMSQCTSHIDSDLYLSMERALEPLTRKFGFSGELTEEDMDHHNIRRYEQGRTRKDNNMRPLHQQRAVCTNVAAAASRYKAVSESKEAAKAKAIYEKYYDNLRSFSSKE